MAQGFKPIEEAPKDGSIILIIYGDIKETERENFHPDVTKWEDGKWKGCVYAQPTYFKLYQ